MSVGVVESEAGLAETSANGGGGVFGRADLVLALITEVPAAILIVVEIGVLFTGVVARYVFHRPIVWTDELASILFLWKPPTSIHLSRRI